MGKVSFLEEATLVKDKEEEKKETRSGSKLVWDCDSCLYDSFELRSFKCQLDSAITSASRSNSMPHFASLSKPPTAPAPPSKKQQRQRQPKVFRPFSKLLQLIFRPRPTDTRDKRTLLVMQQDAHPRISPKGAPIPPPETDSRVRKTVSERFGHNAALGVSYA